AAGTEIAGRVHVVGDVEKSGWRGTPRSTDTRRAGDVSRHCLEIRARQSQYRLTIRQWAKQLRRNAHIAERASRTWSAGWKESSARCTPARDVTQNSVSYKCNVGCRSAQRNILHGIKL